MSPAERLRAALSSVDWRVHVEQLCQDEDTLNALGDASLQLATWCRAIESAEAGNAALPFIRAAQLEVQYVVALLALALYQPAAASMRSMAEGVLYYSYFRSHAIELRSLSSRKRYYIDKNQVLEWHRQHTPQFSVRANVLNLTGPFDEWYARVSAVAHGQIPGTWGSHLSLSAVKPDATILAGAVNEYCTGTMLVHRFLLATVELDVWASFQPAERSALLRGLSKPQRDQLGLSST
jgi:hypothetical protein